MSPTSLAIMTIANMEKFHFINHLQCGLCGLWLIAPTPNSSRQIGTQTVLGLVRSIYDLLFKVTQSGFHKHASSWQVATRSVPKQSMLCSARCIARIKSVFLILYVLIPIFLAMVWIFWNFTAIPPFFLLCCFRDFPRHHKHGRDKSLKIFYHWWIIKSTQRAKWKGFKPLITNWNKRRYCIILEPAI